jgi:hypothetical protein
MPKGRRRTGGLPHLCAQVRARPNERYNRRLFGLWHNLACVCQCKLIAKPSRAAFARLQGALTCPLLKAKERSTEQGEARLRAIGIAVIVVSFLAVVFMVLNYQRNMNQIDQILGTTADTR